MQASAAFAIEEEQEDFDFDPDMDEDIEYSEAIGEGLEKIKGYLKKVEKEYGYMDSEIAVVALGDCYREGKEGVEQDDEKAVMCYEEATEYDCIDGVQMLGVCVFEGRGVEQDYEQAFSLLSREYMEGRNALIFRYRGLCCFNGWGTEQDYDQAFKEFQVGANNFKDDEADAASMFYLGVCYEEGKGTEPDSTEALKWYKAAVKLGNEDAEKRMQELQK